MAWFLFTLCLAVVGVAIMMSGLTARWAPESEARPVGRAAPARFATGLLLMAAAALFALYVAPAMP